VEVPAIAAIILAMNRRDFIGGAVAGGALALGGRALWDRNQGTPLDGGRLTWAQQGEDIVLWHVLHHLLEIEQPTFMDVGAADPIKGNNTYLLYYTGSRGVVIEPNPAFAAALRAKRPEDRVVEAGIGVTDVAEADYYEIKGNPLLNTFSAEQVAYLQKGKSESVVERVVKMPLLNINKVIEKELGRAPDLLSTDIEGLDFAILQSLDLSRFRPGAICAETVPMFKGGGWSRISEYLMSQDYVPRGGSLVNTIYVDARRIDA
jgi:FkbM family methyltransferase